MAATEPRPFKTWQPLCVFGVWTYHARMAQRVQITIDLGAGAPIEVIRQVIDNLDTVCQFAGDLQYQVAQAQAQTAVLENPERWMLGPQYEDLPRIPYAGSTRGEPTLNPVAAMLSPLFARGISRYLDENDSTEDTITTVESIRYSNPIEIVLGAGAVAYLVLEVLKMARDWSGRRRINAAIAADFESQVHARKQLRDALVRRTVHDNIPLSAAQIDDLLTLDVAGAMAGLRDSEFSMRDLGPGKKDDADGD